MDTLKDQNHASVDSRSSAFHNTEADKTFASAFLNPPPLQLVADPEHTINLVEDSEEPTNENTLESQDNIADLPAPIPVSQTKKNEEEIDEIKEPFSLDLDFASGPNEHPEDGNGEDNDSSNGSDDALGGKDNIGTVQQMPQGLNTAQGQGQVNPSYTPSIQNFDQDQSLPSNDIMSQMEASFGQSFSDVQIHENSETAGQMGARAYAAGNEIHFAPGEYNPNSFDGRSLLGHELTHVIQQRQGRVQETRQEKGFSINDKDSLEREADEMGAKAARGEQLPFNIIHSSANTRFHSVQQKRLQFHLEDEEVNEIVQDLKNLRNQSNSVRLLRIHHDDLELIKTAFHQSTNGQYTLRQYIQRFYNQWDYKVRATALLFDATYDHDWTSIALALIPPQTRDVDYFRIMGSLTRSQKRTLRRKYNARFLMIGEGSLDADIRSDFDGVDELRAWIISYRDLTDADNIYLKTQHITSSNSSEIVATLRRLWGYGLTSFGRKLEQWNPNNNLPDVIPSSSGYGFYFQNTFENFDAKWGIINAHAKSLMLTVLHESYSESAEQIFLEYINLNGQGQENEDNDVNGWAFTAEEESNLNIARIRLTSAEHWYGNDQSEIDTASEEIVAIYRGRIERLRSAEASAEHIRLATEALEQVQQRLLGHDANASSLIEQNFADQLYLLRSNQTSYTNKILEIFKQGQLDTLKEEAATATSHNGNVVRPAYDIQGPLRITDIRGGRMSNFLDRRSGDQAGSYWIKDTIDREYVTEASLNYLHTFINAGPWAGGLLQSILSYFNRHHVSRTFLNSYNGDHKRIFLRHLAHIGFDDNAFWRTFRDTLVPAQSDSERVARAEQDMEEESSNLLGNAANTVFDAFTGEDTVDVAETSLRRLQRFANRANADEEEMRVFRAFYGEELDLVSREYRLFEERLGAMRSAKIQVASLANTVVSTVVEIALAPFITPAGSAVVGQVCGILTEWLVNPAYEPLSADNLGNIVAAAATAGAASWTDEAGAITRWVNNQTSNRFLRVAARESIAQTINSTASAFCASLQGDLDAEWIRSHILDALASRIAEGVVSRADIDRIQNEVIAESFQGMAETVVQEMITTTGSIVFGEGENEEAIANSIAQSVAESLISSIIAKIARRLHTEREDDANMNRMMEDADAIEEAGINPGPDLTRESDERTAIVPPAPQEVRRVPETPSELNENIHHEDLGRETIEDLATTSTIPFPSAQERDTEIDLETSDTLPSPEHDLHNNSPNEQTPSEEHDILTPEFSAPSDSSEETLPFDEDSVTITDYETEIDLNQPGNAAGGMLTSANESERYDRAYNTRMFNEVAEMHPSHECGLAYNPHTGEHAVVHGLERQVIPPPGYLFLAHSHPVSASGASTLRDHNPSTQDLLSILRNNHNYALNEHYIRVVTENGVDNMRILIQEDHSFLIDVVDNNGVMERAKHFESILAYQQWLNAIHYDN